MKREERMDCGNCQRVTIARQSRVEKTKTGHRDLRPSLLTLAIQTSTKILCTRSYISTHDGSDTFASPHVKENARRLTNTNRPSIPFLESPRRRRRIKRGEENLRVGHTLCHREGGRRSVCRIVISKSSSSPRSCVTIRIRRRGNKSSSLTAVC